MCHIWSCFAWTLDLIQRIITFGLACIICFSVFVAISASVLAGIAYGYNYSLTEFLTFGRADVTVYVRRGQFADVPDLPFSFRRTGGATPDEEIVDNPLSANAPGEFQEETPARRSETNANLPKSMNIAKDTRSFAEKLTSYNSRMELEDDVKINRRQKVVTPAAVEAPNGDITDTTETVVVTKAPFGEVEKRKSDLVDPPLEIIDSSPLLSGDYDVHSDEIMAKNQLLTRRKSPKVIKFSSSSTLKPSRKSMNLDSPQNTQKFVGVYDEFDENNPIPIV